MTFTLPKWDDPLVLKAGGGLALYTLGGSRTARMLGLALMGWAAWEYFKPSGQAGPKVIPYDPDATMPLAQGQTAAPALPADPFKGTRWEGNTSYTPSVAPAPAGGGGKVIPLRPPTQEEKAMFYGMDPGGGDNVG